MRILISCFFLLFSCGMVAQPFTVAEFFKTAGFKSARLSPSGEYLAVGMPDADAVHLGILDIRDPKAVKLVSGFKMKNNENVSSIFWANNERVVFTTAMQFGSLNEPVSTGKVYATNIDGKRQRQLFGARGASMVGRAMAVIDLLPEQDDWILITHWAHDREQPIAERLNVLNGRTVRVETSPLDRGGMLADSNGVVRFAYGANVEGKQQFAYKSDTEWKTFNHDFNADITPLSFSADGKSVFFSSSETGRLGVYKVDLANAQVSAVVENSQVEVANVLLTKANDEVVAAEFMDGKPDWKIVFDQADEAKWLKTLQTSFNGKRVQIFNWTNDGLRALVSVSSERLPLELYLLDTAKPAITFLASAMPWLDEDRLAETKSVSFTARDGTPISGYLTLPNVAEKKNLPMITLVHGGPHGIRDVWGFDREAQLYASRGYAVLQVNFRGSGGYGNKFLEAGFRNWATSIQDDITDGTKWAIAQGYADATRVCIAGASFGGYSVLASMTREPDLYACGFAFVGVYDLNLLHVTGDIPKTESGRAYLERVVSKDKAQLDAGSPAKHVQKLKAPLFIAHGKEDIRAHVEHFYVLKASLDAANIEYEELLVEKEGHGFYKLENNVLLYEKVLTFFSKHLN